MEEIVQQPPKKYKYRFKKTTYTRSRWAKYDPRGKSSREKDLMIKELLGVQKALGTRIDRMIWAYDQSIKSKKEEIKKLTAENKKLLREKLSEVKKETEKEVKSEVRSSYSEILKKKVADKYSLSVRLKKRDCTISKLRSELAKLKQHVSTRDKRITKLKDTLEATKKRKPTVKTVTKIVKICDPKARKLEKFLESGFDSRGLNISEFSLKLSYVLGEKKTSIRDFFILSYINVLGSVKKKDFPVDVSYRELNRLTNKGMLSKQSFGEGGYGQSPKYFLTVPATELVKDITSRVNSIQTARFLNILKDEQQTT